MKLLIFPLLLLMLFTSIRAHGQLEDYIVDVPGTTKLEVFENFLIFKLYQEGRNYIAMSDLSLNDGSYDIAMEVSGDIGGFKVYDNFLLYSVYDEGIIYQLDLTNLEKKPVVIYDKLISPFEIEIVDNFLFVIDIMENNSTSNERILMIDLINEEHSPIVIVDSLEVGDLISYNDLLIYSEVNNNCMYVVDFKSDPFEVFQLDCISGTANGLARRNNELYVSEAFNLTEGKITKRSLNSEEVSVSVVCEDLQWPAGIVIYNNFIYIAEIFKGTISRLKLEEVSSTSNTFSINEIFVYPNPSSDYLYVSEKEDLTFNIYSVNRIIVMSGTINSAAQICIDKLPSGFYFLHIADGSIAKFQVLK